MQPIDAIIIAGDLPREVGGFSKRVDTRLCLDGNPATFTFLRHYFQSGRNIKTAEQMVRKTWKDKMFLSLNGPYLQQYLGGRGLHVALVPIFSLGKDRLLELLHQRPRAVVISTTFLPTVEHIDAIAGYVKDHAPEVPVIAGGIKIWKSYRKKVLIADGAISPENRDQVAADNYLIDVERPAPIDFFVVSERGEFTLAALLQQLADAGPVNRLNNVAYWQNGRWHLNPVVKEPGDIGAEVMDWRHLPGEYLKKEVPVHAGAGCAYRCRFCDFRGLRQFYIRPIASIIEEIKSIPAQGGLRRVFFTDDNLFCSKKRTIELCQAIKASGMRLKWRAFIRADSVTEETAALFQETGCIECLIGAESGDAGILQRIEKRTTPEQNLQAVALFNQYGINTQTTFLVGFPGETRQSVDNTIALLNAYPTTGPGLHFYYPFLFNVMPLASISSPENRARYQLRGYRGNWSHYSMDSTTAGQELFRLCNSIKLEVSPLYPGEAREIPWLSKKDQQRVIYLRNKIRKVQQGLLHDSEPDLWRALEAIFVRQARPAQEQYRLGVIS